MIVKIPLKKLLHFPDQSLAGYYSEDVRQVALEERSRPLVFIYLLTAVKAPFV